MPTERSRIELLQVLSEKLGPDAAAALMECVPPFPWTELTTKGDLAALEQRLDARFDARLHETESRILRWTIGAVFGGLAAVGGAAAGIAALVG